MKSLTPKSDFLHTPEASLFAEAINQPIVRQGLQAALLEFTLNQHREDHFEGAAKDQYELRGAKAFVATLLNLTEPETTPKPDLSGKLQWHSKPPRPQRQPQQKQPKSPPQT